MIRGFFQVRAFFRAGGGCFIRRRDIDGQDAGPVCKVHLPAAIVPSGKRRVMQRSTSENTKAMRGTMPHSLCCSVTRTSVLGGVERGVNNRIRK